MNRELKGVMPPLVTPFKDQELDLKAFRANLARLNATRLAGYVVMGSNGEGVFLSRSEKEELLAAAREAAGRDKIIVAGTGAESTRETIELTNLAAGLGADFALVLNPSYFKGRMTPDALAAHYRRVADAARLPVMLYNVPKFSGLNMGPELIARLAEHPNIAGLKDSSGDMGQLSEILRLCPADFNVFVGSAPVFYPALCLGARGGILAVANAIPELCLEIYAAFGRGDLAAALKQQRLMTPVANLVTTVYGVPGLKLAMTLAGYQGGEVRSPLLMPADPKVERTLRLELEKPGLFPKGA